MSMPAAGSSATIGALHFAAPQSFFQHNGDRSAVMATPSQAPVRLVEGLADLPAGCWWTNLDFTDLQRANLVGRPDLKTASYLPTRTRSVIAELGMLDAPIGDQAAICARIFDRVLQRAHAMFGLPVRASGNSLADALREHFFTEDPHPIVQVDPVVQYALDSASQSLTQSGYTESFDESRLVVMRHHRQLYAAEMLATPVPFGEWKAIEFPTDPTAQLEWVRECEDAMPLMLRVNVRFTGSDRHERMMLAGFGSGQRRVMNSDGLSESGPRQWIASPEYLALAPYAEIEILDAFAAEGFQPNRWCMLDAIRDGEVGPSAIQVGPMQLSGRATLSYCDGLLAEAMWFGAARNRGQHRTSMSMWLQSVDRAHCLRSAIEIQSHQLVGVQVAGFSRGRVWLRLSSAELQTPEDQAQLLAELALLTGLTPPALPEVQSVTSGRYRIAMSMRERACERSDGERAAWFAGAAYILGNRAILPELL